MRPRYCRSADARMRTQNALLLTHIAVFVHVLSRLIFFCTLGHYPEQIMSQPSSASLATVLSQATPGFQPTSKLCIK